MLQLLQTLNSSKLTVAPYSSPVLGENEMDCWNRLFATSIKFSNPFVCSLKRLWTRKIEFYSFSLNFPLHYGSSHKPNRNCLPEPPTMFKLTRHFFFPPSPPKLWWNAGKRPKGWERLPQFKFLPCSARMFELGGCLGWIRPPLTSCLPAWRWRYPTILIPSTQGFLVWLKGNVSIFTIQGQNQLPYLKKSALSTEETQLLLMS